MTTVYIIVPYGSECLSTALDLSLAGIGLYHNTQNPRISSLEKASQAELE